MKKKNRLHETSDKCKKLINKYMSQNLNAKNLNVSDRQTDRQRHTDRERHTDRHIQKH